MLEQKLHLQKSIGCTYSEKLEYKLNNTILKLAIFFKELIEKKSSHLQNIKQQLTQNSPSCAITYKIKKNTVTSLSLKQVNSHVNGVVSVTILSIVPRVLTEYQGDRSEQERARRTDRHAHRDCGTAMRLSTNTQTVFYLL